MTTPDAPGPMVEVTWSDSYAESGWSDPADPGAMLDSLVCRSVGYLLAEDGRGIVVCSGRGQAGGLLDLMAIPGAALLGVERVRDDDHRDD